MPNVKELIAQKAALEQQIAEAQRQAKTDGIAKVRDLMAEHGLTVKDLAGPGSTGKSSMCGTARRAYCSVASVG